MRWIAECDALVADVTVPSLGVGYEIARAEALGKPVLCLFFEDSGKRLSGMIEGNKTLRVERYRDTEGVADVLKEFFGKLNCRNL